MKARHVASILWEKSLPFFYSSAGQSALPRWVLRATMTAPSCDERIHCPRELRARHHPLKSKPNPNPDYAAQGLRTSLNSRRTQRFATAATVTLGGFPRARKRAASSFQCLSLRLKRWAAAIAMVRRSLLAAWIRPASAGAAGCVPGGQTAEACQVLAVLEAIAASRFGAKHPGRHLSDAGHPQQALGQRILAARCGKALFGIGDPGASIFQLLEVSIDYPTARFAQSRLVP